MLVLISLSTNRPYAEKKRTSVLLFKRIEKKRNSPSPAAISEDQDLPFTLLEHGHSFAVSVRV